MIEPETEIKWRSRLCEPEKIGKILGFIPSGRCPSDLFPWLDDIKPSQDRLGNGIHNTSQSDRYLIEVPRDGNMPLYYAPTISTVHKCNQGLTHADNH